MAVMAWGTTMVDAATIPLDPTATYLRTNADPGAADATPIDLASLGIAPGDRIVLGHVGNYINGQFSFAGDAVIATLAVFSGSATLLPASNLDRVQDAIDAEEDHVTFDASGGVATDIAEDFVVFDRATLVVPAGATHLFVGPEAAEGGKFGSNTDPNGDYALFIQLACGNGETNDGEGCDDGGTSGGDGCSSTCTVEAGFQCAGAPSVCSAATLCGNGTTDPGEECDDANATSGDGCLSCKTERDLTGSWQLSVLCPFLVDDEPFGSTRSIRFTGDPSFDTVTSVLGETCGGLEIFGGIRTTESCSQSPQPVTWRLDAGRVVSGVHADVDVVSPPVPLGAIISACETPPARTTDTFKRSTFLVAETDGAGRATRLTGGQAYLTSKIFDTADVQCARVNFLGSVCSFVALRNDVDVGTNQTTAPLEGASVTFAAVTAPGTASVIALSEPDGAIPADFQLLDTPVFYEVSTTAAVAGPITVCLPYPDDDDDGFVDGSTPPIDEDDLLLLHEEAGVFVNRTTTRDPTNDIICAETASLSQFAFGASTVACGDQVVDSGEDCDEGAGLNGSSLSCCTASCTFRGVGEVCRPNGGECDGSAETCTGTGGACPPNIVLPAGTPCTDDGIECRRDECDGFGGCSHPPVAAGTGCADDGNVCTGDACDGAGTCGHPATPSGSACDDGLACNGADRCLDGACFHADAQCALPPALDHYKCHKVKDLKSPAFEKIADPGIALDDQFGADPDVDVLKPSFVCNPASKNGSGIGDPSAHLCCYKIKGRKPLPPQPQVEISDQFGVLQLEAIKPQVLCQPCVKTPLNF
jgi:cysteine-rich repeat protein